jgi:hypothetical protein
MAVCSEGVLCTRISAEPSGTFTSAASFLMDAEGCPIMPVTSAEVKGNLAQDAAATFYARGPAGGAAAGSVVTLVGTMEAYATDQLSDADLARMQTVTGASVEDLAARSWRRLKVERLHLQDAVRNAEAWVPLSEYTTAEPNPLAPTANSLLAKINGKNQPALQRFAAAYTGAPIADGVMAEVVSVDQLGFDMRVGSDMRRLGFKQPPTNEEEGISLFMKLFQEAFEQAA